MKILHLIFSFNTGGSETMLVDIMNEQRKYEEIHLIIVNSICTEAVLNNISKQVKVYFINRKPGSRNLFPILKLNFLIFKIKPDIIHCHNFEMVQILFRKLIHSKIFLTVHDVSVPVKYHSKYDKIFAISKAVKKDIKINSGLDADIIYNGINFDRIKRKEDYNFDLFHIVQVSRLDHNKKGQDILIKALNILVNKRNLKNIHVDFIGEGKSLEYLTELVSKYNLGEYVKFLGLKDREYIYDHLKDYNLLVQPSIYEGFALTVTEGIAAGLPVLVSNIQGPMEIIQACKYGYYFQVSDDEDCADKILMIMHESVKKDFKDKIEIAYKFAKKQFDVRITAKNYINGYRKVLNELS